MHLVNQQQYDPFNVIVAKLQSLEVVLYCYEACYKDLLVQLRHMVVYSLKDRKYVMKEDGVVAASQEEVDELIEVVVK